MSADASTPMRSAWLKWARAVEHAHVLAAMTRQFMDTDPYSYVRTDNQRDRDDQLIRAHWKLKVHHAYPERWSMLLGNIVSDLRSSLDHAFWEAVVAHSGPPSRPDRVNFPITTTGKKFREAKDLQPLVSPEIWTIVETVQPLHGGALAHTAPLQILRWMSNADKHRSVHIVERMSVDMGPIVVSSRLPLQVVEEWTREAPASDGDVIARLKLRRPLQSTPILLHPQFGHMPTLRISDDEPPEYRSLGSAIDVMVAAVLDLLSACTVTLGAPYPDPDSLYVGAEWDGVAPDRGGDILYRSIGADEERALPTKVLPDWLRSRPAASLKQRKQPYVLLPVQWVPSATRLQQHHFGTSREPER
jgi:hypothetical protein